MNYEALYADLLTTIRPAKVLVIAAQHAIAVRDLVTRIDDLITKTVPPDMSFPYGYTAQQHFRSRLVSLEQWGHVLARLPDLTRNYVGVTLEGESYLAAGSKLLFTLMILPQVSVDEATSQETLIDVPLKLSDVDYLINPKSFEKLFNVPWADYLHEFAATDAILHIQPFSTNRPILNETLRYVMQEDILSRTGPQTVVFGTLQLLNRAGVQTLPSQARGPVGAILSGSELNAPDVPPSGLWDANQVGAYVYATIAPTPEQLETAIYAPGARAAFPQVVDFLTRSRDFPWSWNFLSFLAHRYQTPLRRNRASSVLAFEYLLTELLQHENERWFLEFYNAVQTSHNGDLIELVIQLSLETVYNSHWRVTELVKWANNTRRSLLANGYDPVAKIIWQAHDFNNPWRVGMLASDVDSMYMIGRDAQRIKAPRLAELQQAVAEEGKERIGRILKREDNRTYDEEAFGEEVLKAAAEKIHLSNKDLEDITITRTLRFLDLTVEVEEGIERYYITYEHVERVNDGPWETVPQSRRTVSDSNFEFLLWSWVYNHQAAVTQAFIIGVSILGVLVIAAEVGAIALLIDLAGGLVNVGISIAISELIYLATAEHYTLRGFLMAALDGYLFAVGFRFGAFAGRAVAGLIGRETLLKAFFSWIARPVTTGIVGGASSSALTIFANGLVDVATGQGNFPTFGEFVRGMAVGALMGVAFEVGGAALQPLLRVVGNSAIETVANLVERIRVDRGGLPIWVAATDAALTNIRSWLGTFMEEARANGTWNAFRDRIAEITEEVRNSYHAGLFRHVLDFAEVPINEATNSALDKLLSATQGRLSDESLLGLLNRLRVSGRLQRFVDLLGVLDEDAVNWLAEGQQLEGFANSLHLHDLLATRGVEDALRFVSSVFGGSFGEAEGFLARMARHGDSARLSAFDTLLRPGQRITPQALETVANRLGGLSPESLHALDRLYASAAPGVADAFLGALPASGLPRMLRFLGSLGHEFAGVAAAPLGEEALHGIDKLLTLAAPDVTEAGLTAILNRTRVDAGRLRQFLTAIHALPDDAVTQLARTGALGDLADAANLLNVGEARGANVMWDLISGPFGGSAADAEAWIGRLHAQPAAVSNRALDLILSQGRVFTPEGLAQVMSKAGAISNDYADALNRLYTARGAVAADALLTAATPSQLSLNEAAQIVPAATANLSTIEAKLLGIGGLHEIDTINTSARLQSTGRLANLEDWARSTAPNADIQQPHFVAELSAANELTAATAGPGRVVRVGQDSLTAGTSYDITQEAPSPTGPVIERRVEVRAHAAPIRAGTNLTFAVVHGLDKFPDDVIAGRVPRPAGTFEGAGQIDWPPAPVNLGPNTRIFQPNGDFEVFNARGARVFGGNIGNDFLDILNDAGAGPPNKLQLNRVSYYDRAGNLVMQFDNRAPGVRNDWVRTR